MIVSTTQNGGRGYGCNVDIREGGRYQEQDGDVQFDVTGIWCGIHNVNSNEKCLRGSKLIALVRIDVKKRGGGRQDVQWKIVHINLPYT